VESLNVLTTTIILILIISTIPQPHPANQYSANIARAEGYLISHLDRRLNLIYESDDPGQHWLRSEFAGFDWRYNQTFWLYSDNLFACLALERDYPSISSRICSAIDEYRQPPANLFEVVGGQRILLPLQDAMDFIVSQDADRVVMNRRHNATRLAFGDYVDLWMYEALEYALEGNLASATFLVRRAETFWRGNGLWDWSFTIWDHMFSNQKLALLLFTAKAIGYDLSNEAQMEAHLWSMQNVDGGVTSLSDSLGKKAGSSNAETTALSILIYDESLLEGFPKTPSRNSSQVEMGILVAMLLAIVPLACMRRLGRYMERKHVRRDAGVAKQR